MKKIISKTTMIAVGLLMSFNLLIAGNNPINLEPKSSFNSYFENAAVDFLVGSSTMSESLALVSFNENSEYFSMKTMNNVTFIQILNSEGELEFQLPVKNSLVHLSLKDFSQGDYYINILFEGESEYLTTMLTKK